MVEIEIAYQGQLRCSAVHTQSGAQLTTDAPKDNHGKGESFSPTDLVATALGSCMLTIMGIAAKSLQVNVDGARAVVIKDMVATPVRRIGKLTVNIHVPGQFTDEQKEKLKQAAHSCPVHKSLHPDVQTPVEFTWG